MGSFQQLLISVWLLLLVPNVGCPAQYAAAREELAEDFLLRVAGSGLISGPAVNERVRQSSADRSLEAGLMPMIGPNVRLGDDPSALPADMSAQAEPHIARHPIDPDFLIATFQEGRYTNAGAVSCGYSISRDGGLTWSRSLIQGVTRVSGGAYYRCTDPVAGVDLDGNLYLNTLAAVDSDFDISALLISRSTNGGLSFEPPVEIVRSPSASVIVDKNWMAINTFPNTPSAGRIVSTFTRFGIEGYPLAITHSDDQGASWSPWHYITPTPFYAQGTQPVFLPDGKLAVVYWNFALGQPLHEYVEVVVSTNGGETFNFSNRVAAVIPYPASGIRDGRFLPSACGNRVDDSLYVVYQALDKGTPRIMFTKSSDAGVSWALPMPVSDNPGTAVLNAAVAVSPDGAIVTVMFYDARINPADPLMVDVFLAQSFDGGATWEPNIRVTTHSSDARLAPLTGSGYMLGDYQAIAPAIPPDVPAVGVFIDTRTGDPDPFVFRAAPASGLSFASWRAARMSLEQIRNPFAGSGGADPDLDGRANLLEYVAGTNPLESDSEAFSFGVSGFGPDQVAAAEYRILRNATDVTLWWSTSTNFVDWSVAAVEQMTVEPGANPWMDRVNVRIVGATNVHQFFRFEASLED